MVKKRKAKPRPVGAPATSSARTSFDLLWSDRVRGAPVIKRGPKPVLSLDSILDAGITLADAEGLGALTMARVAEELRTAPMSLYRHVAGKRALVELMSDRALGAAPSIDAAGWREAVEQWARANLDSMVARPWLIEAVSYRTTVGPNWMAWLDSALEALGRSGLPEQYLIEAVLLVEGHARSTAQLLTGAPATPEWSENFGRALQVAQGDARYRTLMRLALAGKLAPSGDGPIPFRFALLRILDGIEAFVATLETPKPKRPPRPRS